MSKIIKVKNTGATDSWTGMEIELDAYYTIQDNELNKWRTDLKVFTDIASGKLVVNDGTSDIADALEGWGYLKDDVVLVKPDPSQESAESKYQQVVVHKTEGSSATRVTHDFTDQTTWYSNATLVVGKVLVNVNAKIYTTGDVNLVDTTHGKIYGEDTLTTNDQHYKVNIAQGYPGDTRIYNIKAYDNGTQLVEDTDFVVDYALGTLNFASYTIVGTLTADYFVSGSSTYVLKPKPGKLMLIEHAELQLSKNCMMNVPINFEVWVYHPDQATYPGIKIPYQMISYKNIKDLLNSCNEGTGVFPAMSGLTEDVVILPFKYATVKPFRDSLGAELRITMEGDVPIVGEWGTATFYILSKDE